MYQPMKGTRNSDALASMRKGNGNEESLPVTERPQARHNPEWYLIHLMLQDEAAARDIQDQVELEEYQDEECRETARLLYHRLEAGQTLRVDRLLDEAEGTVVKSVLTRIGLSPMTFDLNSYSS